MSSGQGMTAYCENHPDPDDASTWGGATGSDDAAMTTKKGRINKDGQTHLSVPEAGNCPIRFPALAVEAGERA